MTPSLEYMPIYSIYGGLLDSEITFDGLQTSSSNGTPNWLFRRSRSQVVVGSQRFIGRENVSAHLTITLSRRTDGSVLLSYSAFDLGEFRIAGDGREIVWTPGPEPRMDALRWVLMGKVMATAMYAGGRLCLHGSAVSIDGRGICFLAPKYHGKSTLAGALLATGARLATDDVLPVEPGPPVRMWPGVPVIRLIADSEDAIALDSSGRERTADDVGKTRIDLSVASDMIPGPEPLAAVYILEPVRIEPAHGSAAVRVRLEGISALEVLIRHTSIATLLSPGESSLLLSHASAIVRSIPVYSLRFIRDLTRLTDVVRQLREWHET